jgi:hypothetical protein
LKPGPKIRRANGSYGPFLTAGLDFNNVISGVTSSKTTSTGRSHFKSWFGHAVNLFGRQLHPIMIKIRGMVKRRVLADLGGSRIEKPIPSRHKFSRIMPSVQ